MDYAEGWDGIISGPGKISNRHDARVAEGHTRERSALVAVIRSDPPFPSLVMPRAATSEICFMPKVCLPTPDTSGHREERLAMR